VGQPPLEPAPHHAPSGAAWGDGGAGHRGGRFPFMRGGRGRGRGRAGWEEQRWREEMDEQLRREAEAEAEAEAEVREPAPQLAPLHARSLRCAAAPANPS
jgi:hypothetical protein